MNIEREYVTKVTIITNEIWKDEEKVKQTSDMFSRHKDFNNYMIKLTYGGPADNESVMNEFDKTKLNFLNNSRLDITKKAKVLEAYSHNKDRLTLLYKNFGSFTFVLNKQKTIY